MDYDEIKKYLVRIANALENANRIEELKLGVMLHEKGLCSDKDFSEFLDILKKDAE